MEKSTQMLADCECCGGTLTAFNQGFQCNYCKAYYHFDSVSNRDDNQDDTYFMLINSGNKCRLKHDFDAALDFFLQATVCKAQDSRAYWGLTLSEFGIEYVLDPRTEAYIPTCRRTVKHSILNDAYFLAALQFATYEQQLEYKSKAQRIEYLQQEIKRQVAEEKDFDVFLSFKSTDSNGNPTEDRYIARTIYDELKGRGIHTFFSEVTLQDRLGEDYEPIIYKALYSSKVMVLVATNADFLESPWVKNEWSRFRDRVKDENMSHATIAVYKNLQADELPPIFRGQGIPLSKYPVGGYEVDLADHLQKRFRCRDNNGHDLDESRIAERILSKITPNIAESGVLASMRGKLRRAAIELEDGEFEKAEHLYSEVLSMHPECSEAWWGLLKVKRKVKNEEEWNLVVPLDQDREYKNAMRFGAVNECEKYEKLRVTTLENRNRFANSLVKEGNLYLKQHNFKEAERCYQLSNKYCETTKAHQGILLAQMQCDESEICFENDSMGCESDRVVIRLQSQKNKRKGKKLERFKK